MSRTNHVREEVVQYLSQHGPLDDPTGRATAKLRGALGYAGSKASFTQLIANMDRGGELIRVVRGRRTYQIRSSADEGSIRVDHQPQEDEESEQKTEMDYDKMASALLVRVVQTLARESRGHESDGTWARRRIERLEKRINELEQDLLHTKTQAKTIATERDELRLQLEHGEANLALLTDRLQAGKERGQQLSKILRPEERDLLHRLQKTHLTESRGRVG